MAQELNRRAFIAKTGAVALAGVGGILLVTCESKNPIMQDKHQTITLDLSKPEYSALTVIGAAVKVARSGGEKPVIVRRSSQTEVVAFSSQCTHQGCEVPLPIENVITCPCHGSKYDQDGNVTNGPARSSLNRYSAVLTDNIVTITI